MKSKKSGIKKSQGLGPAMTDHVQRISFLLPAHMKELVDVGHACWGYDLCLDALEAATRSLALISLVEHSTENDGRRLLATASWLKSLAEKNKEALLVPVAQS